MSILQSQLEVDELLKNQLGLRIINYEPYCTSITNSI